MSFCAKCGRECNDNETFLSRNFGEICKTCYDKEILDEKIQIFENKEQYTYEKLTETLSWLESNGYHGQADNLREYIAQAYSPINNGGQYVQGGKQYLGSKTSMWTTAIKVLCYIVWIISTVVGFVVGYAFVEPGSKQMDESYLQILTALLGGIIGFCVGFFIIAFTMTYIVLCENVSTLTDNVAKLLALHDKGND